MTMRNNSGIETEERDFREWLRRTAEKLKHGEVPPESWETRNPLEDSAAQRRIASLISRIAAKDDRRH
jgi:hypothetical protein